MLHWQVQLKSCQNCTLIMLYWCLIETFHSIRSYQSSYECLYEQVLYIYFIYIIQIYSGITSGRVFDGELLYIKILEVNLFAFAYTVS